MFRSHIYRALQGIAGLYHKQRIVDSNSFLSLSINPYLAAKGAEDVTLQGKIVVHVTVSPDPQFPTVKDTGYHIINIDSDQNGTCFTGEITWLKSAEWERATESLAHTVRQLVETMMHISSITIHT